MEHDRLIGVMETDVVVVNYCRNGDTHALQR